MPRRRLSVASILTAVLGGLLACLVSGCEPESLGFTEVKRLHERVTGAEFITFMRIIDRLPDRKVPPFPRVFPPPPQWDQNRSSPVSYLYDDEQRRRDECWDTERLAQLFERNKILMRELRKEKLTPEQFAGLVLTLGAALCRHEVPEGIDLAALSERAKPFLDDLRSDITPFSSLSREAQFVILQKSMWISRKFRADKLNQVLPENLALAAKNYDWLCAALPDEFVLNPVDEIRDLLEERGMPFEELPDSGSDEDIHWQQATGPTGRG